MSDLTRAIIGIENRTAQEVFDIMCDRFCAAERALAERAGGVKDDGGETLAQEFGRLIREYSEPDTDATQREAWNLIADFAVENAPAILSALTTEPAAPEGRQEAGRIGDAVLDWMVKFDLLDAGNEYYVSDVLAVLNDLTPSTSPSEQAVTDEMVEAAQDAWEEADNDTGDLDACWRAALKAAMEAGHD